MAPSWTRASGCWTRRRRGRACRCARRVQRRLWQLPACLPAWLGGRQAGRFRSQLSRTPPVSPHRPSLPRPPLPLPRLPDLHRLPRQRARGRRHAAADQPARRRRQVDVGARGLAPQRRLVPGHDGEGCLRGGLSSVVERVWAKGSSGGSSGSSDSSGCSSRRSVHARRTHPSPAAPPPAAARRAPPALAARGGVR